MYYLDTWFIKLLQICKIVSVFRFVYRCAFINRNTCGVYMFTGTLHLKEIKNITGSSECRSVCCISETT